MGGNIFPHSRRLKKEEYLKINQDVINKLDFPKSPYSDKYYSIHMPAVLNNKESFGDVDFIVSFKDVDPAKHIKAVFGDVQIVSNGNVLSFPYNLGDGCVAQIDICHNNSNMCLAYHYYGDLSNLIGRIAKNIGLKYSQNGLYYEHYFKGQHIGDILLTESFSKMCEFLRLDYKKWLSGFEDEYDLFDWVIESKYFRYDFFLSEKGENYNPKSHVKSKQSARNKTRPTYQMFLGYLTENEELKERHCTPPALYELEEFFFDRKSAGLEYQIREMEYRYTRKLFARAKFSPAVVREELGYDIKDVGGDWTNFLEQLRRIYNCDDTVQIIIDEPVQDLIDEYILYRRYGLR